MDTEAMEDVHDVLSKEGIDIQRCKVDACIGKSIAENEALKSQSVVTG